MWKREDYKFGGGTGELNRFKWWLDEKVVAKFS